jgi:hypothetical protein
MITLSSHMNDAGAPCPALPAVHTGRRGRTTRGHQERRLTIGPPEVVSINTKHHPAGRVALDGDHLYVNRHPTDYIVKTRREADRVAGFLRPALAAGGHPDLAQQLPVRPLVALVDVRLIVEALPAGVTVTMSQQLLERLRRWRGVDDQRPRERRSDMSAPPGSARRRAPFTGVASRR